MPNKEIAMIQERGWFKMRNIRWASKYDADYPTEKP